MNLKKSDKIIAIVGVVILIVAAVGIIIYAPDTDEVDDVNGDEAVYHDFSVDVEPLSQPVLDKPQEPIKDKLFGNDSVEFPISIPSRATKDIEIFVQFSDRNSGLFGFGRLLTAIGADTLEVTILDNGGNVIETLELKGNNNLSYTIDIYNVLDVSYFRAESKEDAEFMLEENLSDLDNGKLDYTIRVQLDEKETILRPLAWLREKLGKDMFDLTVTYNYESYSIDDSDIDYEGDDDNEKTGYKETGSQTYYPMSFAGFS
jgi:hypothetical protein